MSRSNRVAFCLGIVFVVAPLACGVKRTVMAEERSGPQSGTSSASLQSDVDKPAKRLSARERARARRAERAAVERAKQEEVHRQWLARVKSHGVEPWPEETEAEHAAALERSQAMVDDVISVLPGTRLYETEHFLFVSNMPPRQVAPYVRYLDKMYDWMCELYGVPAENKVWLGGKVPIFAFLTQRQFIGFEAKYFQTPAQGMYGLCHQSSRGDVVIACYRGDDPDDFGQMLVHETSHGFIHRYKTKARLPSWVNEGMADLIGAEMVPRSKAVRDKERLALALLKQNRSLGGTFFSAKSIDGWQYGAASSLNRFLLQTDRESYVRFIEGIKEGLTWPQALERAYGGTPERLVMQYGQSIGVPDLRP